MPFSGYFINRRLAFTQFVTAGGQPSFESHINKQYVLGVEVSSTAVFGIYLYGSSHYFFFEIRI